jgi:hypothetical protein
VKASKTKGYFKTAAMAVIYLLHLWFLLAITASPQIANLNSGAKGSSSNEHKAPPHRVPVTHWSLLQKHIVPDSREFTVKTGLTLEPTFVIAQLPVITGSLKQYTAPVFNHLSADALKRYRLHSSFLI